MRQYEMTYLLSDKVSDNEMTAVTGRINALITSNKGKILGEENWGRRKLAYPIKKQDFATYLTLNFELDPSKLTNLNGEIKHQTEILRHLLIVKDYGKEKLELTADEVAETEEIEEVVGGEKSFEAIEGETEESYDLMAKREEDNESKDDEKTQPNLEQKMDENKIEKQNKDKTDKDKKAEAKKLENITVKENEKSEKKESIKPKKKTTEKEQDEIAETEKTKPAKKKVLKKPGIKKELKTEKADKDKKAEAEADRLAKLDEEIEGILGDDL